MNGLHRVADPERELVQVLVQQLIEAVRQEIDALLALRRSVHEDLGQELVASQEQQLPYVHRALAQTAVVIEQKLVQHVAQTVNELRVLVVRTEHDALMKHDALDHAQKVLARSTVRHSE